MKRLGIFCFIILFTGSVFAQEKPIRMGLEFGVPILVGLNLEYVTPALNAKLAPTFDLSYISVSSGGIKVSFSYFELGSNYYFMKKGKGLYGHLSYGIIGFTGTYNNIILGDGVGKLGINLLNVKLGAKWGNTFYFRPEIGCGIFLVTSEYNTNYIVIEKAYMPKFVSGCIEFNLGFGIAF